MFYPTSDANMGGAALGADSGLTTTRRKALAGESGWVSTSTRRSLGAHCNVDQAGLVHNRKIFAVAVFASLGGLYVYPSVLQTLILIGLTDCMVRRGSRSCDG